MTIRSLSIGQGELGTTPLQIANISAIVANRGFYVTPHLIKSVENDSINSNFNKKHFVKISPENFEPIINGMEQVVANTSVSYKAKIPGLPPTLRRRGKRSR